MNRLFSLVDECLEVWSSFFDESFFVNSVVRTKRKLTFQGLARKRRNDDLKIETKKRKKFKILFCQSTIFSGKCVGSAMRLKGFWYKEVKNAHKWREVWIPNVPHNVFKHFKIRMQLKHNTPFESYQSWMTPDEFF